MYIGVNDLLDSLQDERFVARREARGLIEILEELDEHARASGKQPGDAADSNLDLTTLRHAAQSGNDPLRKIATLALARFGDAAAQNSVIGLLADESSAVRQAAAVTAGAFDGEQHLSGLIDLLKNWEEDVEIRRAAVLSLAGFADSAAPAALAYALKDPNGSVRKLAARALASVEPATATDSVSEALCEALGDEMPEVRANAAEALGRIGGPAAGRALSEAIADADATVRNKAALALARLKDARAVPALAAQLAQAGPGRPHAAEALGNFADAGANAALVSVLKDTDPHVRAAAVESLCKIGDARTLKILESLAEKEQEPTVAEAMARAIEDLSGRFLAEPPAEAPKSERPSAPEAEASGEPTYLKLDIPDVIKQAGADLGCEIEETGVGLSLTLHVAGGDDQIVTAAIEEEDGTRVVRFASICGPADSGNYLNALLLNRGLVYGAISVKKQPTGDTFELSETIIAREATVAGVREIISYLGSSANQIARQLEGVD